MSESVSQLVSDKHCQWSDSGPIKNWNSVNIVKSVQAVYSPLLPPSPMVFTIWVWCFFRFANAVPTYGENKVWNSGIDRANLSHLSPSDFPWQAMIFGRPFKDVSWICQNIFIMSSAQCVLCSVRCHCIFSSPGIICVPGIRYKSWPCICHKTIMPLNWKQHHTLIYILSTLKPLMYSATRTRRLELSENKKPKEKMFFSSVPASEQKQTASWLIFKLIQHIPWWKGWSLLIKKS